ncbi:MAG: type VI secretion system baseplate subunit TssK [bacterium]
MKNLSRLVWSEGMYLGPHHFQAQSRYFEDTARFAISSLSFAPYGLSGCELDAEALRNGTLSLVHARGIFPDGLVFQVPDCDPAPAPRAIADLFSPVRESMTAHLAIPAMRPDSRNTSLEESDGARFIAETRMIHDENTGRDEKPVRLGRKNLRLLLDPELTPDYVSLPLARITRDSSGSFIFDPEFIPPVVDISASDRLLMLLRRLIEIMEDKSASLSAAKQGGRSAAGWSSEEVARFWFLHSVNAGLATLRHLCFARRGHPEHLFLEMSRLAGALCTFGMESHPRTLPVYDHDNLEQCFGALDLHIRTHLEALMPTNCVRIPLEASAHCFWAGAISDQRCLARAKWVFAISSPIGEADLIERVPRLVKICSRDFVPKLVQRALPGLVLTHLPVPPAAVSPRIETQYFGINRAGPCWDHMVQTRQVGIYVPGEIPNPEIELMVILES